MPRLSRTLNRAARPAIALVLVFAQAVAAFGFPLIQTRQTVKACGCVVPCGASTENCCCAKGIPAPEPVAVKPAGCAKCRDRETAKLPLESTVAPSETPTVRWVAAWKARQCRGDSPMGLLAELPAVPPVMGTKPHTATIASGFLTISDSTLASHFTLPLEPPPRCA